MAAVQRRCRAVFLEGWPDDYSARCRQVVIPPRLVVLSVDLRCILIFCAENSHFLDFRLKGGPFQAEPHRRSTRAGNHSTRFTQHANDVLSFEIFERAIAGSSL